jgi:hypothetical protein
MKRNYFFIIVLILVLIPGYNLVFGHCDTMDGPVIADAKTAIDKNNVNYVLKWVKAESEKEITDVFNLIMKVRELSPEARELSDKYFFETLIRVHRTGEGVPFTGVKPSGTPIDEKIMAADKCIEVGNLSPLENLVSKDMLPELKKRFDKVMSLKNFDVNNVEAGRKYIEAYVQFFHYAEGEEEGHNHRNIEKTRHCDHLTVIMPWALSGLFFILSVVFGFLYFRKK